MTERASYHHGDLAQALRAEALRLVREHGVHGFSLRGTARGVGVDVAAVYRHYRDKEALLRAVARDGFVALARSMAAERTDATDPAARLRAVGRAYVAFAVREPELFRLLFGPYGAGSDAPVFEGGRSVAFEELTDALRALADAGACDRPVADAALAAWAAVHGLATLLVDGPLDDAAREHSVETVLDVVVAGLRPGSRP